MPVFPSKSTAISDLVLACSCVWSLYSIYGGMPSIGLKPRDGGMASNNLASVWFALTLAASLLGAFRFRKLFSSLLFTCCQKENTYWSVHCIKYSEKAVLWSFGAHSRPVVLVGPCHRASLLGFSILHERRPTSFGKLAPAAHVTTYSLLARQRSVSASLARLVLFSFFFPIFVLFISLLGTFISRAETNKVTGYLALASMFSMTGCAVYSRNYYQLLACLLMFSSSRAFDITEKRRLGLPPVDWLHYGLAASNFLLVAGLCRTDLPGMDKLRHWTGNAMSSMFS